MGSRTSQAAPQREQGDRGLGKALEKVIDRSTYQEFALGNNVLSFNSFTFLFHSSSASRVGSIVLIPSRSIFSIALMIQPPWASTQEGPLQKEVGAWGPYR